MQKSIVALVFGWIIVVGMPFLYAQHEPVIDTRTRLSVARGLQYLISQQQIDLSDKNYYGSFGTSRSAGVFDDSSPSNKYRVAATSFAGLALLASGSVPGQGKYGKNLDAAIDFIMSCANAEGYIANPQDGDASRMHGHCFAVLFLAEVYGMLPNSAKSAQLRTLIKKSSKLIWSKQTESGGWGYEPGDTEHEGSITVCALQALRASRNVGIYIPKSSIDKALEYLRRSANPDGSFKYRLGLSRPHPSFPLTAAGVSSLNATGEYESLEIQRGLSFMLRYLPPNGMEDDYYRSFYYYGHFYAAQAMYQAPAGNWEKWYPAIRQDLLDKQDVDGSWGYRRWGNDEYYHGTIYPTAVAVLILQIPYHYLSIFQR